MSDWLYRWPWTSTAVPPGTCLTHGAFTGAVCPVCSSAVKVTTAPLVFKFSPSGVLEYEFGPLSSGGPGGPHR